MQHCTAIGHFWTMPGFTIEGVVRAMTTRIAETASSLEAVINHNEQVTVGKIEADELSVCLYGNANTLLITVLQDERITPVATPVAVVAEALCTQGRALRGSLSTIYPAERLLVRLNGGDMRESDRVKLFLKGLYPELPAYTRQ